MGWHRELRCAVPSSATRGSGGWMSTVMHFHQPLVGCRRPPWQRPGLLRAAPLAPLKHSPPPRNRRLLLFTAGIGPLFHHQGRAGSLESCTMVIPERKRKKANKQTQKQNKKNATNASATSARQSFPHCLWTEFRNGGTPGRKEEGEWGGGGAVG